MRSGARCWCRISTRPRSPSCQPCRLASQGAVRKQVLLLTSEVYFLATPHRAGAGARGAAAAPEGRILRPPPGAHPVTICFGAAILCIRDCNQVLIDCLDCMGLQPPARRRAARPYPCPHNPSLPSLPPGAHRRRAARRPSRRAARARRWRHERRRTPRGSRPLPTRRGRARGARRHHRRGHRADAHGRLGSHLPRAPPATP